MVVYGLSQAKREFSRGIAMIGQYGEWAWRLLRAMSGNFDGFNQWTFIKRVCKYVGAK